MPIVGDAKKVLKSMKDQYGDKEGERVFYATANKQGRKAETWEKEASVVGNLLKLPGIFARSGVVSPRNTFDRARATITGTKSTAPTPSLGRAWRAASGDVQNQMLHNRQRLLDQTPYLHSQRQLLAQQEGRLGSLARRSGQGSKAHKAAIERVKELRNEIGASRYLRRSWLEQQRMLRDQHAPYLAASRDTPEVLRRLRGVSQQKAASASHYTLGAPEAVSRTLLSPVTIPHALMSSEFDPDAPVSVGYQDDDDFIGDVFDPEYAKLIRGLPTELRERVLKHAKKSGKPGSPTQLSNLFAPAGTTRALTSLAYSNILSALPGAEGDTSNVRHGLQHGDKPHFMKRWLFPSIAKGEARGAALRRLDPELADAILKHHNEAPVNKTAAYITLDDYDPEPRRRGPGFLSSVLGGAAFGGVTGAALGGGYGALRRGHEFSSQIQPAYTAAKQHLEPQIGSPYSRRRHPTYDQLDQELADHGGTTGGAAWQGFRNNAGRSALIGAGVGTAAGLLRYILSR